MPSGFDGGSGRYQGPGPGGSGDDRRRGPGNRQTGPGQNRGDGRDRRDRTVAPPNQNPVGPPVLEPESPFGNVNPQLVDRINELSDQLFGLGRSDFDAISAEQQASIADPLGEAARQQLSFGLGQTTDPRFEAIRRRTLGSQGEFLRRRGLAGSSAAANQLSRVEGQLGAQEMGFQNQALGQAQSLFGQQLGTIGTGIASRNQQLQDYLGARASGVETLALLDQLRIAETAAENAGKDFSDSGGGSGFDDILSPITDLLP